MKAWTLGLVTALLASAATHAQPRRQLGPILTPGWSFEVKAGELEPELAAFAEFYGDDDTGYVAGSFAYRFRPWLEAGAEAGFMRDTGVGILVEQGAPGGEVEYSLLPLHFLVTLRGQFKPDQLFVPYLGLGLTSAYYRQEIDLQDERTGWSDVGSVARVGVELYLNSLDPDTSGGLGDGTIKQTYLYLEAQRFTTEQSGSELGGDVLVLGFRFTFGRPIEQRRQARAQP